MSRLNQSVKFTFDDVLLEPQFSTLKSRSEADISTYIERFNIKLPIISSNMDTITGIKMALKMESLGGIGLLHRYLKTEEIISILNSKKLRRPAVSVGSLLAKGEKEKIDSIIKSIVADDELILCVDIAHGDSQHMIDTLNYIRKDLKFNGCLMAGAVCTPGGVKRLYEAGANIVRVGIGPGASCSTRIKTGSGFPQLSAIMECAKIAPIVADGGIKTPGDAAKALAAGAKAIMIGGMLAGTDCTPFWTPESKTLIYRGMASSEAREAYGESGDNAEGVSMEAQALPEGSTEQVVREIAEGVRSAMSYSNSRNLQEFEEKAIFNRVSPSVINENIPHFLNRK